jgi:cyclic pyranopterin phosphate synthase
MDKPKSETSADVYSSELIRDDVPERLGEFVRRTHFEPETLVVAEVFELEESGGSVESAGDAERLSHYDEAGQAHMVDVGGKSATRREAVAGAFVELSDAVLAALPQNPKGNPLEVARFAGIMAAKKTADLIPMCHPLALSFVDVQATVVEGGVAILATAATVSGTGVEMEAMVAASVAALTVYDMTKALDKGIRIRDVVLLRKSGGKSGEYRRES